MSILLSSSLSELSPWLSNHMSGSINMHNHTTVVEASLPPPTPSSDTDDDNGHKALVLNYSDLSTWIETQADNAGAYLGSMLSEEQTIELQRLLVAGSIDVTQLDQSAASLAYIAIQCTFADIGKRVDETLRRATAAALLHQASIANDDTPSVHEVASCMGSCGVAVNLNDVLDATISFTKNEVGVPSA